MKRIVLLTFMLLSGFALSAQIRQVSPTLKACNYESFLYKGSSGSGYAGESNNGLEVSYSSKTKKYGVEFSVGYRKMSISCSYWKQLSDGMYAYSGIEINTFNEAVILTKSKLSSFLNNNGQEDSNHYDESKVIQVYVDGLPDLYVYPIKYQK